MHGEHSQLPSHLVRAVVLAPIRHYKVHALPCLLPKLHTQQAKIKPQHHQSAVDFHAAEPAVRLCKEHVKSHTVRDAAMASCILESTNQSDDPL